MNKNSIIIVLCLVAIAAITYFLVVGQIATKDTVPAPLPPTAVISEEGPSLTQGLSMLPVGARFGAALSRSTVMQQNQTLRPMTFFIPADEALESYTPEELSLMLAPDNTALFARHMVPSTINLAGIENQPLTLTALDNTLLTLSSQDGVLRLNGSEVLVSEIVLTDGVIYIIDSVLTP